MSPNVEDGLSSLPEEIVSHILSLMPTKYAVRTSILSKEWRYRWTLVTNLDFDDFRDSRYRDIDSFTKFVDRVLKYCKASQVKYFRLHLFEKFRIRKSSVACWIDKAIALRVCELDIDVLMVELPPSLFTCKTLTKLRLQDSLSDWECPSSVYLPFLKNLNIAVNRKPLANAYKLIRGCPILESLSFKVNYHYGKENYIFNIPTLKRLELVVEFIAINVINKAVLNVPNLEYLIFQGNLFSIFVMKDLPWLVEASVSAGYVACNYLLVELLKGVSRVKSLSTTISIKNNPFHLHLPVFPNTERLKLEVVIWRSGAISRFVESCPELKYLCIENVHGLCFEKSEESSWIEPKSVPSCMLTNLTTIKFSCCTGHTLQMQFLEYMLQKAKVLKTVAITWYNLCTEEEKQLCARLLAVPKASRNCEIRFC